MSDDNKLPSFDEAVRHRDFLLLMLLGLILVGVFIALTFKLIDQEDKHVRDVEKVKVKLNIGGEVSSVNEADESVNHMLEEKPGMKSLNLETAGISDEAMPNIGRMFRLKSLNIAHTKISGAGLKHITHLPLGTLNISGLKIDDAAIAAIAQIKTLEKLSAESCELTDEQWAKLASLTKLQQVNVTATPITDRGVAVICKDRDIRKLTMNNTKTTDACLKAVGKLHHLKILLISDTDITMAGVARNVHCPSLVKLHMNGCVIQDGAVSLLVQAVPQLTTLAIHHTNINDAELKELTKLQSLSLLELPGCKMLTQSGIQDFQSEMPGCKVVTADVSMKSKTKIEF